MEQLIARIGIPNFIQIILEVWNSVFLLIMIFSMLIGKRINNDTREVKIPLADEITIFFCAIFLYNFFDIVCGILIGDTSGYGYVAAPVAVICYYAVGEFQTLFFLQVVKKHIAEKNGMKKLKNAFTAVQLMNIPLPVLLAATPFTGALYWFDEQNRYHRGTFYPVWYYITIFSFVFIFAVFLFNFRKTDRFLRQVILTASVIPLIAFICNFTYTSIAFNNVSVSIVALILFVLYEKRRTEVTAESVRETERVKVELEQSKNKILMAQIRPHFILNSLTAIGAYLDEPEKAQASLSHFARFLRSSIDVLEENGCIRAEREFATVNDYLYIEKARFGKKLNVETEINDDDFFIPAFALQTLAENAVNHGIRENPEGRGTVRIISYETDTGHIVEVQDDGKGFDPESGTPKNDGRSHIGLSNLRSRLSGMCEGTLEIESEPGKGTTARIRIPKNAKIYLEGKENEHTDS
mgnify:CR=1 FL=1